MQRFPLLTLLPALQAAEAHDRFHRELPLFPGQGLEHGQQGGGLAIARLRFGASAKNWLKDTPKISHRRWMVSNEGRLTPRSKREMVIGSTSSASDSCSCVIPLRRGGGR